VIQGVAYEVDREAVVVRFPHALTVASSAIVGGGLVTAHAVVNLHVPKNWEPPPRGQISGWQAALDDFVARRAVPSPYVGLCTSAWTEQAEVLFEEAEGLGVLVLVSVGLGNPIVAGVTKAPSHLPLPSTINTIVVVDAEPGAAALVNLIMTVTEVKTSTLREVGVRLPDGQFASGTSTDAVVIAATACGRPCEFGGPLSDLGAVVARATRQALGRGARAWMARHA
jgi:iron complex transport system ATP-binding protein